MLIISSYRKETQKRAAEFNLPWSTMSDQVKKDLRAKTFLPTTRLRHGSVLWSTLCTAHNFPEHQILLRGSFHSWVCHLSELLHDKCDLLGKGQPHFTMQWEHNPQHIMLQAGVAATILIGPLTSPCMEQCWKHGSHQSWRSEECWMTCGCSKMAPHPLYLSSLWHFEQNFSGHCSETSPTPLM